MLDDFDLADEGEVRRSSDLYQPFFCGPMGSSGDLVRRKNFDRTGEDWLCDFVMIEGPSWLLGDVRLGKGLALGVDKRRRIAMSVYDWRDEYNEVIWEADRNNISV